MFPCHISDIFLWSQRYMDCCNWLLYVLLLNCAVSIDGYIVINKFYGFAFSLLINAVILLLNCPVLILYYLPPAAKGLGREIIKRLPYVCASVCPSVHSSHFYINLNISFIYKDIFSKFAGNVYGYKNMSAKFWPQNGHYSQLFENHKDALKILKYCSLLHQICTKDIWLGKLVW